MQIGLKMEAADRPTLNMNAMENYLLSHSLKQLLFLANENIQTMHFTDF